MVKIPANGPALQPNFPAISSPATDPDAIGADLTVNFIGQIFIFSIAENVYNV